MTKEAKQRMNALADKYRSGVALTDAEDAELSALEAEFLSGAPAAVAVRSVWDLPVAKPSFEADRCDWVSGYGNRCRLPQGHPGHGHAVVWRNS